MDQDIELKVKVDVGQAEQNLDNLDKKVDRVADSVDDLNKTTEQGVPSVGSLDKAFESAFNTIAKEGGKGGAVLKKVFDSVKNAIPVIKNINSTAITGLKGIKAAIASTGIGLLVVALGEVLAHWQDIAKWIGIGTKAQDDYTKAVERSEAAMDRLNFQHEKEIRLLKAAGASNTEIAEVKVRQAEEDRKQLQILYAQNQAQAKNRKERKQLTEEYQKQSAEADKALTAARRELEIVKEEEKIKKQRAEEEKKAGNKGSGISTGERLKEVKEESKSIVEELKKNGKDVMEIMTAIAHNLEDAFPEESVNYFKKLLDPESARASSDEVIAELKKAGVEINNALISGLLTGDAQEYQNKLQEMISARHVIFEAGHKTLSEDLQFELEIQNQAYENETQILAKRMEYIKKYVGEGPEYKDLESQLVVIGDEREAFLREQTRKIAEAVLEEETEVLEKQGELLNWDVGINLADFRENYKQRQEALQQYFASMRDSYDEGSVMYEKYAEEYERITEKLNNIDKERVMAEFQYLDQQLKYWRELAGGIADILGSVADIREEDIRQRLKDEKISEEQAEREFDRVKKLQIAQVWINTLSGAIGSFMQASATYPPPGGQILGATLAAAALASGIAQTQKIKNTTLNGGTGGGGGVSAPSVGVTPLQVTDDIQVSPSALAQSQNPADQRVYILESDLQESDRRVEIREANTSF